MLVEILETLEIPVSGCKMTGCFIPCFSLFSEELYAFQISCFYGIINILVRGVLEDDVKDV